MPFVLPKHWPQPADAGAATRLLDRFQALGPAYARLAAGPARAMLQALGGNSPYLADLCLREAATIGLLARLGPDEVTARALARLERTPYTTPQPQLAERLRTAKRQIALATAIADIGGLWTLEAVTATLSRLAERALQLCTAHLLRAGHDRGEITLPDRRHPEHASGFVILAMGKLGAGELNYSSDIDLVLLHDPDAGVYRGDQASAWFSRLSRGLVTLMEARDANGYVFRTDLRLRPDPAATPPCVNLHAAIAYYESMGQNWERAAMLKARPIAGDLAMGANFLEAIRPFIWRRHLDFAAVADIHAMKRRIDEHRKTALSRATDPVARIAGHNVKLGQGGIREIEFLVQTLQLVWGGRDPGLREPRTLPALRLLVRAGHLQPAAARALATAYRFLRAVEHRLQMVADRQTHTLPETPQALAAFAIFLGYADAASFARALLDQLNHVGRRYAEVFGAVPGETAPSLDFNGADTPPATLDALAAMGFAHPTRIADAVTGWQAGRVRALRSARARDLLATVLPPLLAALARQTQPDAAFMRFAGFLERLPAGVQLLSLFHCNPGLIGRVASILGAAPQLADHLARTPSALDGLLGPHDPPGPTLRTRLAQSTELEDAIATIRRTVREADFAISVATLEGRLDADAAGLARAQLADAALSALLPRVLADFARRFGRVTRGSMVVVLLGKAGGRETMAGSDLDLMLIYDRPDSVTASTGPRPLPSSQWFIRAVHSLVAALTAPDAEGPTYQVDMRLRPSGNKGPVAVSLSAFETYHAPGTASGAWTWERMALTRARVVAGPASLRARVETAIRTAITSGNPAAARTDAAAMRARLQRELPAAGPWDVKHRPGGQMEVEFIVQTLQLLHGPISPTLRIAAAGLARKGHLSQPDAALLIRADRIWRTIQGMLRITDGARPPATLSEPSATALLRAARQAGAPAIDLPELHATLDALAQDIRSAFTRIIGPIAS